jgi:hypothetical protein
MVTPLVCIDIKLPRTGCVIAGIGQKNIQSRNEYNEESGSLLEANPHVNKEHYAEEKGKQKKSLDVMDVYLGFIIRIRHKPHGLEESRDRITINAHESPENNKNKPRVEKSNYSTSDSRIALQHTLFYVVKPKPSRYSYQKNEKKNKLYRVSNATERGHMVEQFIGWRIPSEGKDKRHEHEANEHTLFLI